MEYVPVAIGQSEGVPVFWEGIPEIGVVFPRSVQLIEEIHCGTGMMNYEHCLILYLFAGEVVLQMYLKQFLPTSPDEVVDGWEILCAWNPDVLKVRYGDSPMNKDKEITLLLPGKEGERITDKLSELSERICNEQDQFHSFDLQRVFTPLCDHISTYIQKEGSLNDRY